MQGTALCQNRPELARIKGLASAKPNQHHPRSKTILLAMKLTTFILLIACLHVSAKGITQVTFSGKDVPLERVFEAIKKQTGYSFLYNSDAIKKARPVTIDVKDMPVEEVLAECLRGQPFDFKVADKTIFILPKKSEVSPELIENGQATETKQINVTGRVVNEKGESVSGVSVTIKGTNTITTTNSNGEFSLTSVDPDAVLVFSHVSMETFELKVSGKTDLAISLKTKVSALGDVTVIVNTGYEKIPKERATGSFGFVNNEQLNRKVGTDILSRLEGVTTGILFDRRQLPANQSTIAVNNIMIRGLNTMTASMKAPLIVIDNFPYNGDINNINPNDVETITILKDAAAASIYGARAANGVIVITTKSGNYNQPFRLSLISNVQISQKPDLFAYPKMSQSDFIDVETMLFNEGFYNDELNNPEFPGLSPVVEILNRRRLNEISASDSAMLIGQLRTTDVRNDFDRYIYRTGVNAQYALNMSGGGPNLKYSLLGGYDKSVSALAGDEFSRITLRSNTSFTPVKNLELNLGISYTNTRIKNNSLGGIGGFNFDYSGRALYPYGKLVDAEGNPLVIPKNYRVGYTDTAGGGKLLDWGYRPLQEIRNSDNKKRLQDLVLGFRANYKLTSYLQLQAQYEYEHTSGAANNFRSQETYFTRNLINLYTQIDNNSPVYMIPLGGIMDFDNSTLTAHQARLQLNFDKAWGIRHRVTALAGGEIRDIKNTIETQRLYGFDPNTYTNSSVDYITRFPLYGERGSATIPDRSGVALLIDRFVSTYGNIAYTYAERYTLSASARKDAANIFGVNANNRWKPLWTVGGAWNIYKEPFYNSALFPLLRLRATYGYQGNVNNTLSPYTIITYFPGYASIVNQISAGIASPANPELSWESIRQFNVGIDFSLARIITGTVEFYSKKSNNLIWEAPIDPTTGRTGVKSNSASMTGQGVEVRLNSTNLKGAFQWNTEFGYSYVKNTVTNYGGADIIDKAFTGSSLISSGLNILGFRKSAPYSIYSYAFAGLDPVTGNPRGYLGKTITNDYQAIFDQVYSDTASIVYHGSAIPTSFGYFNNIFRFKGFSLLVNINYRLGYYFRKSSVNYFALISGGAQHNDYAKRWQAPGDEEFTTVPSFVYPLSNSRRDDFYAKSSANVLKGDNVRLQNIRLSYDFRPKVKNWFINSIQAYCSVENLGILWRANKEGLDPDYDILVESYPVPKVITFGLNLGF